MSVDPMRFVPPVSTMDSTAIDGGPLGPATRAPGQGADAAEAARAFESYIAQVLVKEMRRTIPEGIFSSNAMEIFSSVLDQELSSRIASSGQLGLAESLEAAMPGGRAETVLHPEQAPEAQLGVAPRPVQGRLSSRFGKRRDPFDGGQRMHKGIDIAAPRGSGIQAVRGGEVVLAGEREGYGKVVVVDHGKGVTTLYAHCDALKVRKGQRVQAGAELATVGDSGRATGAHLHFEVRVDGKAVDPGQAFGWKR